MSMPSIFFSGTGHVRGNIGDSGMAREIGFLRRTE